MILYRCLEILTSLLKLCVFMRKISIKHFCQSEMTNSLYSVYLLPCPHCFRPQFSFLSKKAALVLILPFHVFLLSLVQLVHPSFFPVPALSFCPCRTTASITECDCKSGHYANMSFIPRIKKAIFFFGVRTHCAP